MWAGVVFLSVTMMACGPSSADLEALTERVAGVEAQSQDREARLVKVESQIKGIGYEGLRHRWSADKWVKPDVRCRGPESMPRDFSASPATICIRSGFRRSRRPDQMRVQARSEAGEIVFHDKVPWDGSQDGYCLQVQGYGCTGLHSLGLGTSPPSLKTF